MDMPQLPKIAEPMSAYDFLTVAIPAVMREEPKRVQMKEWCASSTIQEYVGYHVDNALWRRATANAADGLPGCQTVGCIAGWGAILLGYRRYGYSVKHLMQRLLDLEVGEADYLFEPWHLLHATNQGTAAHVADTIAHILDFANDHEAHLKSVTVTPLIEVESVWSDEA